jgi:putative FmdB family regulatory protein
VPTYQYACTDCGDKSEVVQRFTDDPLTICSACGGKLRKVFSPVGIVFKGSGFYRTDSRKGASTVPAGSNGSGSSGEGASSSNGSSGSSSSSGDSGSSSKSADSSSSGGSGSSGDSGSSSKSAGSGSSGSSDNKARSDKKAGATSAS